MAEIESKRKLRLHWPVFGLLVVIALLIGLVKFWMPAAAAHRQEAENVRLRREKASLQSEHDQLQSDKQRLASKQGLELTARRAGYLRPGDRRLVFVAGKEPPKKNAKKKEPSPGKQ
jgi:hypothetical protein